MKYKEVIPALLKDIRFWILFFFLLRMYGITNPPLEIGHNWRQADGLMIARNFYEHGANILYPTVDVAGEKSGIVGCEFPILNYLVYLVSLLFGYDHWYGRIIVLVFSSIGVLFFYKLIHKYFGESPAFNASIILLVSYWFACSRKNMPDAFAVSLALVSLYYALQFFEQGKFWQLTIFFILGLLACLSKVLAASILTVLLIPVLDPANTLQRKFLLSFFSLLILAGVYIWYFVWVPHLNNIHGFGDHFFMGMTFSDGIYAIGNDLRRVLKSFYDTALKYTGFAVFLFGLYLMIRKRRWLTLAVFALPFFSFMIMLIKTGASVAFDTYYVITVIPSMAFIAGSGLAQINNARIINIILIIVSVEGLAARIYDFRIRQPFTALRGLESIMDNISDRNDRIVVNAGIHNPTPMYLAHRRGWTVPNEYLNDSTFVNDIRDKGCRYALIGKKLYGDVDMRLPIVYEDEYFKIYEMKK